MNKEIIQTLGECGLSKEDIAIYMDLITHGDSTPLAISKNTHIPRTTVYRILDTLRNLGVVSIFKKNNIQHYVAENPRRLLQQLKEKQSSLESVLPQIDTLLSQKGINPGVRLYTGKEGARIGLDIFYEYLDKQSIKQVFTFSDSNISKLLPKYLIQTAQKREKMKILMKMIAPLSVKQDPVEHQRHYKDNEYKQVRFLKPPYHFEGTVLIGGSMIVNFSIKDKELHTVVLESDGIVNLYRQLFQYIWDTV